MSYSFTTEELTKSIPSVYKLVVIAARRVRELHTGSPKLIETPAKKPVDIALSEIRSGKITCKEVQ